MNNELITIKEASERFDKAEATLKQWIRKGKIKGRNDIGIPKKPFTHVNADEIYSRMRSCRDGRRMYTTVRTDSTEHDIAVQEALGNHELAEGVRYFAKRHGIPINDEMIKRHRAEFAEYIKDA